MSKRNHVGDSLAERECDEPIVGQNATQKIISSSKAEVCSKTASPAAISSPMVCYPIRICPGEEIRSTLMKFVKDHHLDSAFIMTCVGSVTHAKLRLAHTTDPNYNRILEVDGKFEIVSLVGTLSDGGHLHISLSDKTGKVIGGHVLGDLRVFTTAEIVIGQLNDIVFTREIDPRTKFDELVIKKRKTDE